jgi:hypothetical protein
MAIGCDRIRLGAGWFQDTYFGWYFVYVPTRVARSMVGDHSCVEEFLEAVAGQGLIWGQKREEGPDEEHRIYINANRRER